MIKSGIKLKAIFLLVVFIACAYSSQAQIIQFQGPNRDGIFSDKDLLKEWPEEGPEILFTTEGLGKSNASCIATEDRIYTSGNIDTMENVTCMDFQGNILWQKPYGRAWKNSFPETRCTPTLENNRLFMISGMDEMVCMDAENGEIIWKVDLHEKYNSDWDMFGVSESPLLVDNKVIASIGGETAMVIALDKISGELVWKSESMNAKRSNITPTLINHCGKKYIITANQTHVIGVDAETGEIMWDFHHNKLAPTGDNATILTNVPTYKDSCLWISSGWDVPSSMLRISVDGTTVEEVFSDRTFDNQNHGVVLIDGYLYGSNFTGRTTGKWVCMNWETGEIVWIEDFHTKGPIISADGMLYLYEEKRGHMALVKADPKKFEVISSFRVTAGNGPHWARPAIYSGMLLVRHGQALVAYKISN